MTSLVDRLIHVPIREVWEDEARDLTPWLADNVEALSEALGIDLELEGTEVRVGPFSADLLLRDANTGKRVVVENMMANTNHDHVGKLITYAAGLEATHAVLVAETFRPEHRSALQWLNANSTDSVHFFGVVLKAWRIGDSNPAPQLDVVVEPDEWMREVREETPNLSDKRIAYRDFWSEFLPEFQNRHFGWSRRSTPSKDNWMNFPAGRKDLHYSVNFCRAGNRSRFRIELYVDAPDKQTAAARFDELQESRGAIEGAFGEPLEWDRLDKSRGCRIASYFPQDVGVEDRDQWDGLRAWAIERIGLLREAFKPVSTNWTRDAIQLWKLGDGSVCAGTGPVSRVNSLSVVAPQSSKIEACSKQELVFTKTSGTGLFLPQKRK